jgi:hypothetical protein
VLRSVVSSYRQAAYFIVASDLTPGPSPPHFRFARATASLAYPIFSFPALPQFHLQSPSLDLVVDVFNGETLPPHRMQHAMDPIGALPHHTNLLAHATHSPLYIRLPFHHFAKYLHFDSISPAHTPCQTSYPLVYGTPTEIGLWDSASPICAYLSLRLPRLLVERMTRHRAGSKDCKRRCLAIRLTELSSKSTPVVLDRKALCDLLT